VDAIAAPLYIVTGVLLVAGVTKMLQPSATATALRTLAVPSPMYAARALGLGEVALTTAAFLIGAPLLWAGVALSYGAFTVFILWALRDGAVVGSCGCFGREDTPPTPGHAAFNAAAAALAGLATTDPVRLSDFDGSLIEGVLLASLVGIGITLSITALTALPRTLALAKGTAAPVPARFNMINRRGDQ
jgi:hypothetical protein